MTQALYAAGGAATTVLAVLALVGWFWRRLGRPLAAFLRDWFGEQPRPGLPEGRPGMPARVTAMEGRLERVETELSPNGGRSTRDRVEAMARRAGIE